MRFNSPSKRVALNESVNGFEIVISPRKNTFITLVYLFIIGVWVLVGYFVLSIYFNNESSDDKYLLLFVIVLLSLIGIMIIYKWINNLFGRDHIYVKGQTLSIRKYIHGLGFTWKYDLNHVSKFRTEARESTGTLFTNYRILFDYKNDTYGFGVFNDEQEAQSIINEIQAHHDFSRRSITPY